MPIKKSAIKKARQDEVRKQRNRKIKLNFRTKVKAVREAVGGTDTKGLPALVSEAFSSLDKAAKKGVIHKNTASRKKSRLSKQVAKSSEPEAKKVVKTKTAKAKPKTKKKAAK
ncbi:30S ribosomal protein S20 [bacterium CG2_30_37_16]|nr:MAG: 30S ribosomal protein S20 [bacterium CG2_30_37_16]PIP30508.1 MAG: 30S ribosomal protein S20 [bacterium (Candidatus Howlettbacteria) CG23_combo_of_CG06-09_8_20_14_all_37_9]PIX99393.1 MAG: 30S ribosomal protein S20 [bacterium (Candidatus Howlettbacteria) CG_4_10_14_3_um_filter_37_10]PJB07403.1 MAG: 30S ribosomal protein S20 [bacterium (Candidatus Howlettbacteria) CG_4_9_14_3_um_filter_37_10]